MSASPSPSRRRAYWLKTLHEWHWVSSAICLVGLLLFSITGFTLNHAGQIEAKPKVQSKVVQLEPALLQQVTGHLPAAQANKDRAELPSALRAWIKDQWDVDTQGREAEWSKEEVYLSLPRPGGDAWLRLNLQDGELEYERTDRGWLSYFNDLHKGRNTGVAWSWFIDIFAAATLVFSITGLFILKMHAGNRPFTWPMAALGLVIPVLLALLFIH
ncbi:PepSY-associated TM helix domain-containing protein [Variovorax sp. OV329]|uniref:PepSY-associated TM helix domain-containing protein n=1 Tax=Variovorax sp. OV329 TaxID=1882825 RepID=UPI0008E26222|nr:PepSY-associated TM helix domain-containing protein [Variovorax sp. OV329]SFM54677.1 hypothetical protein SAMN05444747_106158 [Variovorax sp. OV329]